MIEVRAPRPREADAARDLMIARYGTDRIPSGGTMHDLSDLECRIAVLRHTPRGAVYFRTEGTVAEIIAMAAMPKRCGTGAAIVAQLASELREADVTEIGINIVPDDETARRFLEAQGFRTVSGPAAGLTGGTIRLVLPLQPTREAG